MTIITTKNDKKPEKLLLPVEATAPPSDDAEANDLILIRQRNVPSVRTTTLLLILIGSFVMSLGIIGGFLVYKQYAREQMNRFRFHGFCQFPYNADDVHNNILMYNSRFRDGSTSREVYNADDTLKPVFDALRSLNRERELIQTLQQYSMSDDSNESGSIDNSFNEEFELEDDIAKINVPTFRDGRFGRFIHDFKMNQTGIIDMDANRCFVMPLDREQVAPPKSMRDLIFKVWNGYYNIDTDVVRQNMRVVVPALEDTSDVSPHVMRECSDKKIYRLEPFVNGVFKRSTHLTNNAKFAEFAGKNIVEYNFVNLDEVIEMENKK
jgi:integral membrane protein 2B